LAHLTLLDVLALHSTILLHPNLLLHRHSLLHHIASSPKWLRVQHSAGLSV
jgi:hypothetical protein